MAFYGSYYGGFAPYVPVAKRRAQALRKAKQLEKSGQKLAPVTIDGRTIARTFWGKAWCEHFEGLGDYANRLPRGRTYVRNGSVIDLQISKGKLTALVSGSDIYEVSIEITPVDSPRWKSLVKACSGKIDSVVELLSGELSHGVMEQLCDSKRGLFPGSHHVSLDCSCPDGAWLCKHLAAVLYGVGAKLDREPALLFVLRGVDQLDLVSEAAGGALAKKKRKAKRELDDGELASVFGIELDSGTGASASTSVRAISARPRKVAKSKRR